MLNSDFCINLIKLAHQKWHENRCGIEFTVLAVQVLWPLNYKYGSAFSIAIQNRFSSMSLLLLAVENAHCNASTFTKQPTVIYRSFRAGQNRLFKQKNLQQTFNI